MLYVKDNTGRVWFRCLIRDKLTAKKSHHHHHIITLHSELKTKTKWLSQTNLPINQMWLYMLIYTLWSFLLHHHHHQPYTSLNLLTLSRDLRAHLLLLLLLVFLLFILASLHLFIYINNTRFMQCFSFNFHTHYINYTFLISLTHSAQWYLTWMLALTHTATAVLPLTPPSLCVTIRGGRWRRSPEAPSPCEVLVEHAKFWGGNVSPVASLRPTSTPIRELPASPPSTRCSALAMRPSCSCTSLITSATKPPSPSHTRQRPGSQTRFMDAFQHSSHWSNRFNSFWVYVNIYIQVRIERKLKIHRFWKLRPMLVGWFVCCMCRWHLFSKRLQWWKPR